MDPFEQISRMLVIPSLRSAAMDPLASLKVMAGRWAMGYTVDMGDGRCRTNMMRNRAARNIG